jgi:hypothetical protein
VPEDSLVISESDKDDSVRERKIVRPKQSYSERQTSSKERDYSNDTSNVGATMWVKDKTPNLGHSTGNLRVKQISSDPTKVSELIELSFGDSFFEMLSKDTNLYYFQNQGKMIAVVRG